MSNHNQSVVKRLSLGSMKTNRGRNAFIVLAVTLTCLLIGSIFSIGMSLMESMRLNQIRLAGTVAHAAAGHLRPSQIERLKSLDYVKAFGLGNAVGYVDNTPEMGKTSLSLHYFDQTDWEQLRAPAMANIEGNYPQKENEIMLSRWLLEKLGITKPFIGMQIPISYYTDSEKRGELFQETFHLSGWFTSYIYVNSRNAADLMLVSEALSQKHGKSVEKDGSVSLLFNDPSRAAEYCVRLAGDLGLSPDQPVVLAEAQGLEGGQTRGFVAALCAIAVFLMFTGYLLIYNVLYISLARDVRFFGLLKTLGTTSRQMKHIVTGQMVRLCVLGIPLGLALSLLLSYVFIPTVIAQMGIIPTEAAVSFSPLIYIGAALFTALAAMLGAVKPANMAANIPPVEAQKYAGGISVFGRARRPAQGKLYKMALRNIFRDKKRAGVVFLSLFLGLTCFMALTTLVSSMDISGYVKAQFESDFLLINHDWTKQSFGPELLAKLQDMPGLESLSLLTRQQMRLDYSSDLYADYVADFMLREDMPYLSEEDIQGSFKGFLAGIDSSALLRLNETIENPIDLAAFERGDIALIAADHPKLFSELSSLSISPIYPEKAKGAEQGGSKKIVLPLGGFVPWSFKDIGSGLAPTLIISNTLMHRLYTEPIVFHININVSEGYDEQALQALKQLIQGEREISLVSKAETLKELNRAKMTLSILGGVIAMVVSLIGILNFVNAVSVGIMVRRHELAVLESIGMGKRQMRKLLIFEGLGYALISIALVLSLGSAISYGVYQLFERKAGYAVFNYPLVPLALTLTAVLAVCLVTPRIVYSSMNKAALTERMGEGE